MFRPNVDQRKDVFSTRMWCEWKFNSGSCVNKAVPLNKIQGDSFARGPKLLSIKIMLLRWWLENLYTRTGNDAKQDLLIIDAENGLLSISVT